MTIAFHRQGPNVRRNLLSCLLFNNNSCLPQFFIRVPEIVSGQVFVNGSRMRERTGGLTLVLFHGDVVVRMWCLEMQPALILFTTGIYRMRGRIPQWRNILSLKYRIFCLQRRLTLRDFAVGAWIWK